MILRTCDLSEFINRTKGRTLVCFGAGSLLSEFCQEFCDFLFENKIAYIVDNNPSLWGTKKCLNDTEIDIKQPDVLYRNVTKDTIILITCGGISALQVFESLNMNPELADTECYYLSFIRTCQYDFVAYDAAKEPEGFRMNINPVIPKKIHYCWVGGNRIPERNRKCIESWKRFCPDYEIIEWNEKNYDFTQSTYMLQAYEARKWGFVPDYARLDIIYNHGGIYLDTDVEVIKPLDDLLYNNAFCGFEGIRHVNMGSGFGARTNFQLLKEIRDSYNAIEFQKKDGSLNLIPSPILQTDFLLKHGLNQDGRFQVIKGMTIYPVEYFAPLSLRTRHMKTTSYTYSIHWFDGSWIDKDTNNSNGGYAKMYELAFKNEEAFTSGRVR